MLMAVKFPLASNGGRTPLPRNPLGFFPASIPSKPISLSLPLNSPNPHNCFCLKPYSSRLTLLHRRLPPIAALESDVPQSHHQGSETLSDSKRLEEWSSLTAKFSGAANVPFMLLQLPQIILNTRNLLAGNTTALLAVPWLGMLTGLLGNLSLLSYFAKKREKEAMVIQTLGSVTTFIVFAQLAIAGAMPLPYFLATSAVVSSGLLINFMNYFNVLPVQILKFWEDFITVGGFSVLPQVMWSTFVPFIPNSILPGITALVAALLAVASARAGKLPEEGVKFVGALSGWTATLLFMWMPVSQMWTNYLNPENIKGLSALTMFLALIGNGLVLPRALFIRDFMWFLGSGWAMLFYGYGNIVCLYCCNGVSREFFIAATAALFSWIGFFFWRDSVVYGFRSPLTSLKELLSG
ncbi:maltose excess protein 1-like, chloroplastic isoform X1 [Cucurbita moschata]|uniref:Maltose excess protein 1-like, chloroplastic isoform X1 n=2 Tax=Cucurbita moschata TaxID=3662 RepID=A0A6J1FTY9_CUCMO|nr:maltose excess protein 1-like, chloroplastic isoform X1 [Cucurbita moschata]